MNLLAKHRILANGCEISRSSEGSDPDSTADLVGRLQQARDRTRAVPPDPQLSLLGGEQ